MSLPPTCALANDSKPQVPLPETEADDNDPVSTAQWLLSLGAQPLSVLVPRSPSPEVVDLDDDAIPEVDAETRGTTVDIGHLYQVCQKTFQRVDLITWDYGPNGSLNDLKKVTLTITRPDGQQRIYKSRGEFTKKSDAKGSAAAVAIESGALDFITTGSDLRVKGPPKEEGEALEEEKPLPGELDEARIREQCKIWRMDAVQPVFTPTTDVKGGVGVGHGCVVSIYLSGNNHRSWSVDTTFVRKPEARAAVCTEAIRLGILDYIAHGDGLVAPLKVKPDPKDRDFNPAYVGAVGEGKSRLMTQQSFYDALPKPLPSPVGFGSKDINPVSFVNQLTQRIRAFNVIYKLTFTIDAKMNLHGCLLRLEHGDESYSYLVPTAFAKRSEAKAAACLLAVSQRVSDVVRDIQTKQGHGPRFGSNSNPSNGDRRAIESKLPEEDQLLGELCLRAVSQELKKFRTDASPKFEYPEDPQSGRFGAVLEVWISHLERRKYFTPVDHKLRRDAKLECCTIAVRQGVLEFIRFLGRPPPPGYVRPPIEGVDIPYEDDSTIGNSDPAVGGGRGRSRSPGGHRMLVSHDVDDPRRSRALVDDQFYDDAQGRYPLEPPNARGRSAAPGYYSRSSPRPLWPADYDGYEGSGVPAGARDYDRGRHAYSDGVYYDSSADRIPSDYVYDRHRRSTSPPLARAYDQRSPRHYYEHPRPSSSIAARHDDQHWERVANISSAHAYSYEPSRRSLSPVPSHERYNSHDRSYPADDNDQGVLNESYSERRGYSPGPASYSPRHPRGKTPPYSMQGESSRSTTHGNPRRSADFGTSPFGLAGNARMAATQGSDTGSRAFHPTGRTSRHMVPTKASFQGPRQKPNGRAAKKVKSGPEATIPVAARLADNGKPVSSGITQEPNPHSHGTDAPSISSVERINSSPASVGIPSNPRGSPDTFSAASLPGSNADSAGFAQTDSADINGSLIEDARKRKWPMDDDHSARLDASKTIVEQLLDLCQTTGRATPVFHSSPAETGGFKVWLTIGRQKFELQTTYTSVETGKERLGRQVLSNLKSDAKKRKLNDAITAATTFLKC